MNGSPKILNGCMRHPPHLDGSHVTNLFRSDLRLFVGCGSILRISCVCQDRIRQFCVQSIGSLYIFNSLLNLWPQYTSEVSSECYLKIANRYVDEIIPIEIWRLHLYLWDYLDTCDGGIIRMQWPRPVWFSKIIYGRLNLRVDRLCTWNWISWRIYLNLESLNNETYP